MNKPFKLVLFGLIMASLGLALILGTKENKKFNSNEYSVKKVIDGDTIEVERFGKTQKVRLIGIDTPETLDPRKPVQCFGKEASDKNKALLSEKQVRLEFDPVVGEKDKYNRLLAYVWSNNELINLKLIKDGYAHEYTYRNQDYKYRPDFKLAQSEAKNAQLGFWSKQTCNGITK